ncbi:MAG: hypothetical protein R3220_08930, partial [Balneolaceae bacterium]|nr:hypothetical protein [Balneolaceae bacterium]
DHDGASVFACALFQHDCNTCAIKVNWEECPTPHYTPLRFKEQLKIAISTQRETIHPIFYESQMMEFSS